ncbi:hypothetical protein BH23VER1_BH23VER1_19200 [soil metagenome]
MPPARTRHRAGLGNLNLRGLSVQVQPAGRGATAVRSRALRPAQRAGPKGLLGYDAEGNGPLTWTSSPAGLTGVLRLRPHRFHDRPCIYHQGKLVARHARSYDRSRQVVDPEHQAALVGQQGRGKAAADLLAFEALSALAAPWLANLQRHHPNHLHHVRQILRLRDLHGADGVARALGESDGFGVYTWPAVCHIVERHQRAAGLPAPAAMAPTASRLGLLDIRLPGPDLSHYPGGPKSGCAS